MICRFCGRPTCKPGGATECWESMLQDSLPVAQVLDMLRANKRQQDDAGKKR